jgi:hypothetical protein
MKIRFNTVAATLVVGGALALIIVTGCTPTPPAQQPTVTKRWEVFGTANGSFLLNVESGESYWFVPQYVSWVRIQPAAIQFNNPPAGSPTPGATNTGAPPTPSPTPPASAPAPAPAPGTGGGK